MKKFLNKRICFGFLSHPITRALLAAISISLLTILAIWKFELRSTVKWFFQAGLLAIPLFLFLYVFFYRTKQFTSELNFSMLLIGITTSALLTSHLLPAQMNPMRSLIVFIVTALLFLCVYSVWVIPFLKIDNIPWKGITVWLFFICGLISVALILYDSSFARLYSDDLCYAVNFDELGFPGAASFFYRDWSGRFFSNFLVMGFTDQARSIMVLIGLTIISTFSAVYFLLSRKRVIKKCFTAAAGALFFMATISIAAPDFYKSFFWISSIFIMFPIFIIVPIYLLGVFYLLKGRLKKPVLFLMLGAILSFCITTTHEVGAVSFLTLNGLALIWARWEKKSNKHLQWYLIAAIIAGLLGLAVMLSSPGIENRAQIQQYPGSTPILQTIPIVVRNFFAFIRNIHSPYYAFEGAGRPGWLFMLAMVGLGWTLALPFARSWRSALVAAAMTLVIVLAASFPAAYVFRGNIPIRTQMIPTYFMTLGAFFFGALLPKIEQRAITAGLYVLMLTALLLGMVVAIPRLVEIAGPLRQYAQDWDARDAYFRKNPGTPEKIDVPWDEYEQNINCAELYYAHIYALDKNSK